MPSSSEGVPVEHLRTAVRQRIAESSFRAVAHEVGMSPSGLHSFLGGTSPHYSTIQKVTRWMVREARNKPDHAKMEALQAALVVLTEHLPEGVRQQTVGDIVAVIRRQTERSGVPAPAWLTALANPW